MSENAGIASKTLRLKDSKNKTFKKHFFESLVRPGGFEAGIMVMFPDSLKTGGIIPGG
ncbi:MAG TPA: hypothetical protein PKA90_14770 [Ignavibacteria bacterium]|nr:hypothetical protein [Ignavibacteria bacterium]HMR41680.1 hypothetical protein [Ignavibacteria bacterium]